MLLSERVTALLSSQLQLPNKARVVVAVSGRGRSLQNLLAKASHYGSYEIVGLIASRQDCPAVTLAESYQLPVYGERFSQAMDPSPALLAWLRELRPDWIVLAGFLSLFPTVYPPTCPWAGRIINIHPALLPAFGGPGMYGQRVHTAVLKAGVRETGASVHFVDQEYDRGRLIAQIRVPVQAHDSSETLAGRVFQAECQLLPAVLDKLIRGQLPLAEGGIYDCPLPSSEERY